MLWLLLTLLSAVLLGLYDFFKKVSLRGNAVPMVLLVSVFVAALCWGPWILWSWVRIETVPIALLRVEPMPLHWHWLVFAKSILVGVSWSLAFTALKHLPLSIAGPIRSTSPLWTILIAVCFFSESPKVIQWVGIGVVLGAFYAFSFVGKREGIQFLRNRWVYCMGAATLLGAFSSIYDKYLLQRIGIPAGTLQAWFSVYLIPVMVPWSVRWVMKEKEKQPFQWRWSIPLIALTLLAADFAYFTAIAQPGALIAMLSPIRRTSVVIPFFVGIMFFGERGGRAKLVCVLGLLFGVFLIALGSR